jgi:HAD superfamily hydrolase (TIGR01509 family)
VTAPQRGSGTRAALAALASLPDPGALVFDLDGTLVDTVAARIGGWLETFTSAAIPADLDHVAGLIGSDGKRLAHEVARRAGRELDEAEAERLDAEAGARYDRLNTDPRPLPGARELLLELSAADLPWAIATSSRAEQVRASVGALRLPRPPLLVDGSHVTHAKPAPDLLLLAAQRLSCPPERCWNVGDATWDMAAATAAGMVAVGVASGAVDADALLASGASVALESLHPLRVELERRGWLPPAARE